MITLGISIKLRQVPGSYDYDGINRLIRENIAGVKTVLYDYDIGGNLLTKKEFAYTLADTATVKNQIPAKRYNYVYKTAGWKDQLESFNGCALAQDTVYNPDTCQTAGIMTLSFAGL